MSFHRTSFCFPFRLALAGLFFSVVAGQPDDTTYSQKIREYTTDPRFLSDLVDHLPLSESVPSPLDHFGHITGTPGILHYTDEIYHYFRVLDDASDRVTVRSIGKTEENRDMIEVVVADEKTIDDLQTYRTYLNSLADPRNLSEEEGAEITANAKPIYYITAGLHSPETGSPEMLMELAYRMAVDNSPYISDIRENVIFIFVPVAEPDGRDRMVDIYNYRKAHDDVGPSLIYWGHYVAHDNNRDGYGLALALTRNILGRFLYWKPTVCHDLHESVPYLYVSTGTGPYNEYVDPITIDEWHNLAHEEVTELTKRGMPGVWTHGFYTGWAANYLLWIANLRNSIGRFYETFGNAIADTKERELREQQTSREWYRPNPPLEKIDWSLRNNTNYMESGLLVALNYVARHRERFVENFLIKSRNAVQKGRDEAPHAWVIPPDQKRTIATADFVDLLLQQGIEVHVAQEKVRWSVKTEDKDSTAAETSPKGSYIVRMDQPYRTLIRVLLDEQRFPEGEKPPYDDTGWTLPHLWNLVCHKVDDPHILSIKMGPVTRANRPEGGIEGTGKKFYLVNNTTDDNVYVFRFNLAEAKMLTSDEPFSIGRFKFNSGTLIIPSEGNPENIHDIVRQEANKLHLAVRGITRLPTISTHEVETPRIALVHTWISTPQSTGWWRLAFDRIGIPYTYLSEQDLGTTDLSELDVIIMPHTWASAQQLVAGNSRAGHPLPWKNSPEYRHIGIIDETDDTRKGMGYEGLANLKGFIESGGVFITEGGTAAFPINAGITRGISVKEPSGLQARGTILRAVIADSTSPIVYGYDNVLPVYFNQSPVLNIHKNLKDWRMPDWLKDEIWEQEVPRAVLQFAKKDLLMSGMLRGQGEISGTPVVVDVPVGHGHVVLFANRPFWRWETRGSHALVFNTMLHWNDLRLGWPERLEEEEAEKQDHLDFEEKERDLE